jgi:cytochrome c2
MYRKAVGGSLLVALLLGITGNVPASELGEAQALYKKHCSLCHGLIGPDTAQHFDLPDSHSPISFLSPTPAEKHLAFAPPYGPPLRGVYGRVAGSITGFPYSRAFKETLQGVVWTWERLDVWIADSQAWVPGSRMFYQQPDAEIRRKIIMYLEANR